MMGSGQERAEARRFGVGLGGAFGLIALSPMLSGHAPRLWAAAMSAALLSVTLLRPVWMNALKSRLTPIVDTLQKSLGWCAMALAYFAILTPVAYLGRLMGRDPLRLKFDPALRSYWIERDPPGPPPGTLNRRY